MSPSLNKEVELDDGNRSVWGVKYWVATLCLPLCVLWEIFFKVLALIRILVFASGRNPAWLSWGRKPDFRNGRGAPDSRNHWIRDWGASTTHFHQLSPWLISLGQFYFLTLFLLWARRHSQNLWEVFLARGTRYHEQLLLEPQDWLKRAAAPPEKGLLCCPPNQTPESPATPVRHPLPPFSCQLYAPWLRVSTLLEVSAQLHCLWGPTALGPYLSVLPEPLEPICTPEVQCLMLLAVVCVYVFLPCETGNLSKTLTALIDLGLLFKLKYLLISLYEVLGIQRKKWPKVSLLKMTKVKWETYDKRTPAAEGSGVRPPRTSAGVPATHSTRERLFPTQGRGLRKAEFVRGGKAPLLAYAVFCRRGLNLVEWGLEGRNVLQGSLKVQCHQRLVFELGRGGRDTWSN